MELTITLTPEQAAQFEQTGKLTIQKDTVTTSQPGAIKLCDMLNNNQIDLNFLDI